MSMLIECKMCHHTYGGWRAQCSACGHPTPRVEPMNTPRVAAPRAPRTERAPRTPAKTSCAFCRVRGAKDTCATCGALIHSTCRTLHDATHREHVLRVTSDV